MKPLRLAIAAALFIVMLLVVAAWAIRADAEASAQRCRNDGGMPIQRDGLDLCVPTPKGLT